MIYLQTGTKDVVSKKKKSSYSSKAYKRLKVPVKMKKK